MLTNEQEAAQGRAFSFFDSFKKQEVVVVEEEEDKSDE